MEWNFNNDLPIYTQLMEKIQLAIVSGQFQPGQKLAAVRDLAAEARVNPNTLQRAFQELERMGLVYSQRGSGRYVTEDQQIIQQVKATLARGYVDEFRRNMTRLGYGKEDWIRLLAGEQEETA